MTESFHDIIRQLKRKYRLLRFTETLCVSVAAGLVAYMVLHLFPIEPSIKTSVSVLLSLFVFIIRSRQLALLNITDQRIIRYLNNRYIKLEESADLLGRDESTLTSLQRLQRDRVWQSFAELQPHIIFPNRIWQCALILVVSLVANLTLTSLTEPPQQLSTMSVSRNTDSNSVTSAVPAEIKKVIVTIVPPAYTSIPSSTITGLAATVPEGSTISWNVEFSDSVETGYLVFGGVDSVKMRGNQKVLTIGKTFLKSTFYQLIWKNAHHTWSRSDYYTLSVVTDQAPKVGVENVAQFTLLQYSDKPVVQVVSAISDDYGVRDAIIVATVSKGSGESVKFREEKLSFTTPDVISGKNIRAQRAIDLVKLGMEPGDELYFYVEATDHHAPQPNHARTETFFIALQDTSRDEVSIEAGLSVDLMPEYFRSQRQIIIDSEKLLREQKRISKKEFNSRSNELGYDQKVLRLRYGEFLGEEFESGIGPTPSLPDDGEADEDVVKQFGHAHDNENEHNLVPQKQQGETHDHKEDKKSGDEKAEDPTSAFAHAHDNTEEATFFEQSIRAKLKAALAIMWDAELHLRMFDPERSLPYQYRALKLLKEISNDSRIYVHRTGFDPPPVKEDKRLTGDLSEIKNSTDVHRRGSELMYPAIREALTLIEKLTNQKDIKLDTRSRQIFQMAGNEVSLIVLSKPGTDLQILSDLKKVIDDEVASDNMKEILDLIHRRLSMLLPPQNPAPAQRGKNASRWDDAFIKELNDLNQ